MSDFIREIGLALLKASASEGEFFLISLQDITVLLDEESFVKLNLSAKDRKRLLHIEGRKKKRRLNLVNDSSP